MRSVPTFPLSPFAIMPIGFSLGTCRRQVLGISPLEATVERRGFYASSVEKRQRIESVGSSFLNGYHAAVEAHALEQLRHQLALSSLDDQGFAYEGAAMGLALLDRLFPWRQGEFARFLGCSWNAYPYLTHVGLGWALARIPGSIKHFAAKLTAVESIPVAPERADSLLACLALDGYAFHQCYFSWEKYVQSQFEPTCIPAACLPIFRQGVGRSLCFVMGMDPIRVANAVAHFPRSHRSDLWSGVGLATAYAGGFSASDVQLLKQHAASHLPALAQGVAFAAKARHYAQAVPEHTHLVCDLIWQQPVVDVAHITDMTLADVSITSRVAAYAHWRKRIQEVFLSQ